MNNSKNIGWYNSIKKADDMNFNDVKKGLMWGAAALPSLINSPNATAEETPSPPAITAPAQPPTKTTTIDINKIAQIESNNNPKAVNKRTGARGICQIMEPTWKEMTGKLGVDWSWDDAFDKDKNMKVSNYYFNTEIPKLLKAFKIPDTIESRLAAYNWGVGNLSKNYNKNQANWQKFLPEETKNYITKYKS